MIFFSIYKHLPPRASNGALSAGRRPVSYRPGIVGGFASEAPPSLTRSLDRVTDPTPRVYPLCRATIGRPSAEGRLSML
jgi:hypothetical protein